MNRLLDLVQRHRAGAAVGITSVCSAHPTVLQATLTLASATHGVALIEATSNQVNQEGGYTGMRPAHYRNFVYGLADSIGLAHERIVLGGDHLGPNCWQGLDAATALAKSAVMVAEYVAAGFSKIHLDCSMRCADDPGSLSDDVIAERTATLCEIAENAWRTLTDESRVGQWRSAPPPVYIIGSEVPVPGGAHETLEQLAVTTPDAAQATIDAHRRAFERHKLGRAWERVIGLVVQPGVEFDHDHVIDYQPAKARALSSCITRVPDMVYEAHSTDYQTPAALEALVKDHFAILKVGPAVTFALRETLWALSDIATELKMMLDTSLKATVLEAMRREPKYWKAYYVDADRREFDLQFSLSDRIRYYWSQPDVSRACARLLDELGAVDIPMSLLSQYLPCHYVRIRAGRLRNDPRELVLDGIAQVLRQYAQACDPVPTDVSAATGRGCQ